MKLKHKLPAAFGAVLALMFAAGATGLVVESRAVATFSEGEVEQFAQLQRQALDAESLFKTQVQEWKNTLLRGHDAEQHTRYWKAFQHAETEVAQQVTAIRDKLSAMPDGQSLSKTAGDFLQAHQTMAQGYRKGLAAFDAAQFDHRVGDAAVKGVDREPAKLLEALVKGIDAQSNEVEAKATAAAQAALRWSMAAMVAATLAGLAVAVWISRQTVRPLEAAVAFAKRVAQGDLTSQLDASGTDEVADLRHALRDMQSALGGIVRHVRSNADALALSSQEIASGNLDLSQRTEQQATAVQEQASAMEELSATVEHNAQNARQARSMTTDASQVVTEGGEAMKQVVQTMQDINTSSRKIGDIIGVIDGIAFQTNILALNAAVEAARAGEAGRGFAVVASEVRSLAGRSAAAAQEIKGLIEASVAQVDTGTRLVDSAGEKIDAVVAAIGRISGVVTEMAHASEEQSTGVGEVGRAISQLDQTTQQNAALVEEMAASADKLQSQAKELVEAVAIFRVG